MVQEKVLNFQISRLGKIFLLLGVSFFPVLGFAQNPCSGCYSIKRPSCEKRCQGAVTRVAFSSCVDSCVSGSCGKFCNTLPASSKKTESSSSAQSYWDPDLANGDVFHGVGGECGKCLRRKSAGSCISRCSSDDVEDVSQCRRSCAKLECSASCQLPNEESESKERKPTARDCGECKRVSDMACKGQCENLKDQPGYTTCVVSCVEDKCNNSCNPE